MTYKDPFHPAKGVTFKEKCKYMYNVQDDSQNTDEQISDPNRTRICVYNPTKREREREREKGGELIMYTMPQLQCNKIKQGCSGFMIRRTKSTHQCFEGHPVCT